MRLLHLIERVDHALLPRYAQGQGVVQIAGAAALELDRQRLHQALTQIPTLQREALEVAADRIRSYAERQRMQSWEFADSDGTLLGQIACQALVLDGTSPRAISRVAFL